MNLAWIHHAARIATPFAVLVIIVFSWVPGDERPHTGASGQFEHLLAYALAAAGMVVGFPTHRLNIALRLIGLAAILEVGQLWIPGRTSLLIDFIVSSGGTLVGVFGGYCAVRLLLAWRLHRVRTTD